MKPNSLYICYYDIEEPLVRTQVLPYLRILSGQGNGVHLLTFERDRLSRARQQEIRAGLRAAGISWHALRYHKRPSLPATLFDVVVGVLWSLGFCVRHQVRLIHARSHVPAAMALCLKALLGRPFLFDLRGLLADEYVDAGNWRRGGVNDRLTRGMERIFFRKADAIVMLTERIRRHLLTNEPALAGRERDVEVIPCCVDIPRFRPDPAARQAYREQRGWGEHRVLTYLGKLGTWYLPREMTEFFAALRRRDGRFVLQVLTQSPPGTMLEALRASGVPPEAYAIRLAPPDQVPMALAASDAGVSFIRPTYSKWASSPTKIGEYLAAGLPVVVNAGVGDLDALMTKGVGLVVREFSATEYEKTATGLIGLLEDPTLSERCRLVARQELSLDSVGGPRYARIYERLISSER